MKGLDNATYLQSLYRHEPVVISLCGCMFNALLSELVLFSVVSKQLLPDNCVRGLVVGGAGGIQGTLKNKLDNTSG